jgi:hypothetical protein
VNEYPTPISPGRKKNTKYMISAPYAKYLG